MGYTSIRYLKWAAAMLLGCLVAVVCFTVFVVFRPHVTDFYRSPLTGHVVEVWVYGEIGAVPGDSASGKGFVCLKNSKGEILERKNADVVVGIPAPVWHRTRVEAPLFADWNLTK